MKIKKSLICLLLSGAVFFIGNTPIVSNAYAGEITTSAKTATAVSPRAEQTEWVYRFVNGKLQKRLWSITYGKWLTKWQWA